VIGPSGNYTPMAVAVTVNLALMACSFALVYNQSIQNYLVIVQCSLTSVAVFLMFYVACKDPGIINPSTHDSDKVRPLTRDLNGISDDETHY